jgi:hypothetical protein
MRRLSEARESPRRIVNARSNVLYDFGSEPRAFQNETERWRVGGTEVVEVGEPTLGSNQVCSQWVENKQRHAINIASP